MSTVLYLTGHIAIWLKFGDKGVLKDQHVDRISHNTDECNPGGDWVAHGARVDLIVDSEHEEIEAHPLLPGGSWFAQKSNRVALRKKLIEANPDAIVHSMNKQSKIDAVLIQHINLSDSQLSWLATLQKKDVTIRSICTATEVHARFFNVGLKPCLTLSYIDGLVKHTFCRSGVALFTRAVSQVARVDVVSRLAETLTHLQSNNLIDVPIPVFAVGLPAEFANTVQELPMVSDVTVAENMFANLVKTDQQQPRHSPVVCMAKGAIQQFDASQIQGTRHVTLLLDKYRTELLLKKRMRHCAGAGLLMLGSGIFGITELLHRADQHRQILAEKVVLQAAIMQYQTDAQKITDKAVPLTSALLDKLAIESTAGVNPAKLLTIVAQALQESDLLALENLTWVLREHTSNEYVDSQYLNTGVANSASFRSEWSQQSTPSLVIVSLSGSVSHSVPLTNQQQLVTRFAKRIRARPEVKHLEIIRGPLSKVVGQSAVGTLNESQDAGFELAFTLVEPLGQNV